MSNTGDNISLSRMGFVASFGVMLLVIWTIFTNRSAITSSFPNVFRDTSVRETQPTTTVTLQDGDTYDMYVEEVAHTIDGASYRMLAYNGSVPGPTLQVVQGSTITLTLHNNSPHETMLHSHGLRLKNASDGSPLTQDPIMPGESYTYTLTFPDAGIYWYHPHVREDLQQDLGMYGAVIVNPRDTSYWEEAESTQVVFVDDVLIDGDTIPKSTRTATHTMMGTYGNTMLVNGATDTVLQVATGQVNRMYFINSANTRPFRLTIPGAQLKLIGSDAGAYEYETMVDSITLGSSERAIVDIVFPDSGTYKLQNQTPLNTTTLATIDVINNDESKLEQLERFNSLESNQSTIISIDPYRNRLAAVPDKTISLSLQMMGMGGMGGHMMMGAPTEDGIEWEDTMPMMNQRSTTDTLRWLITDEQTKKTNMDISWQFTTGNLVRIRIINSLGSFHPMQHPIHFHGNRFLITAIDGVATENLVWKDTAMIPAGREVDLLLEISNPGMWMAHCHIAEHLEAGMMFHYSVTSDSAVSPHP